jgi:hypothetical protein
MGDYSLGINLKLATFSKEVDVNYRHRSKTEIIRISGEQQVYFPILDVQVPVSIFSMDAKNVVQLFPPPSTRLLSSPGVAEALQRRSVLDILSRQLIRPFIPVLELMSSGDIIISVRKPAL